MQQLTCMVLVSETHHLQRGPLCTSLPPVGSLPKENGAGNKQPSVQHYMRHLPVVATLKNIKSFQYVNAVNNDEDSSIKCHCHTYMYICTQTNTHTKVQWMEYTSCRQYPHFSIQLYKFKHCKKSLYTFRQGSSEPTWAKWPVSCFCPYLLPSPPSLQPHSLMSLKIHSCQYKGS